ncbi:MAG: hypothetical protein KAS32_10465 [Candidatus Peribacteraceae bacterium]|nr:hypothetical protein [Candidatus Peribacteraceae bacterium]
MTTQLINIKEIQKFDRPDKDPYWKIFANEGQFSCFDEPMVADMFEHISRHEPYSANVEVSGNFKNIRKPKKSTAKVQQTGTANAPFPVQKMSPASESIPEARASKDKSMYTSYAKDLFCVIYPKARKENEETDKEALNKIMTECVTLVKQARDAF